MKVKVQVVTITDDGQETTREIACVERQDLTPETFGLALAEGKAVLQALQEVVVEWQMQAYLQQLEESGDATPANTWSSGRCRPISSSTAPVRTVGKRAGARASILRCFGPSLGPCRSTVLDSTLVHVSPT
jgi:hypothetical protein